MNRSIEGVTKRKDEGRKMFYQHCDMYGQEQVAFKVVKVFPSEDIAESEDQK